MSIEHVSSTSRSTLATNKVIRNTYTLLSMTLAFSALTAFISLKTGAQPVHWLLLLAAVIGVPMAMYPLRNSVWALPLAFVYTGFLGYALGPIIGMYLNLPNGGEIVAVSLTLTATIFLGLSTYALTTRKDFSFLGGFVMVGSIVLLVAILANVFFLQMPILSLIISTAMVMLISASILWQTSQMVHNGETNYILMTVALYTDIFVLFLHLLRLVAFFTNSD